MAIGLGTIFGLKLPLNFDSPLKSTNISDFWRRWHMTMTRFFTAYIYSGLAMHGMRQGMQWRLGRVGRFALAAAAPSILTFLFAGVWHGGIATTGAALTIDSAQALSMIVIMGAVALLLPNTQQILHHEWPVIDTMPEETPLAAGLVAWKPKLSSALLTALVLTAGIASDLAPDFYPALSPLRRFNMPCWAGCAMAMGA